MASGRPARGRPQTADGTCPRCGARMEWVTLGNGSRVPLDWNPDHDAGEVWVIASGTAWRVGLPIRDRGLAAEVRALGHPLRRFHSDTCAKRRPRERADLA